MNKPNALINKIMDLIESSEYLFQHTNGADIIKTGIRKIFDKFNAGKKGRRR